MLHEWLSKLETQQRNFQGGQSTKWNPLLIQRLKSVSNPVSRDADFLVANIFQRYITGFVVDTITSYSEVERKFFMDHEEDT